MIWVGWTDFWVGIPAMEHDVSVGTLTAMFSFQSGAPPPRSTQGALMGRKARGFCTRRYSTINIRSCRQTRRNVRGSCRNKRATLWYASKVVNKHPSSVHHWQQSAQKTKNDVLIGMDWKPYTRISICLIKSHKAGVKSVFFTFGWRDSVRRRRI